MNDRLQIEREIEAGIERMQRDLNIPQETTFPGEKIAGYVGFAALIAMTVVVVAYAPRVKAQEIQPGDLTPGPVWCQGAQKHIKNVLSKTGMFKDAFALSGEGARQVSENIFGHVPPADHIIIIRQVNSGSIMVPCIWGKNGPEWDGNQSNRVEIDFVFKRDLEQPKTEPVEKIEEPQKPKKKRTRKGEQ
jgi:hypothetical protein